MLLETIASAVITILIQQYTAQAPAVKKLPAPPRPIGAHVLVMAPESSEE